MTDEQKIEWDNLYDSLLEKPRRIFEIFSDYFGEDKVDFQGVRNREEYYNLMDIGYNTTDSLSTNSNQSFNIIVWLPEVQVTNENDNSVIIKDLYAKVNISCEGELIGKFYLNRATYNINHIRSNYMHSHVSGINTVDFSRFLQPCTGSGPINNTIAHLNREYDEDLWQLFCSELDDFTQVESLAGIPYRKLESISKYDLSLERIPRFSYVIKGNFNRRSIICSPPVWSGLIKDFTRYLLKSTVLPMEYSNGTYCLGMSFIKANILFSNKFIEWFNLEDNPYRRIHNLRFLQNNGLLRTCVVDNGRIYSCSSINFSYNSYEGSLVCTFKGRDIRLHIENSDEITPFSILLSNAIVLDIASAICKVINLRYGRNERKDSKLDRQTLYI